MSLRLGDAAPDFRADTTPLEQGDDVIIVPAVSDAEAKERFPNGWRALTPYLRLTKQPSVR
jgi:hypothetical protein